MLMFEQVAHTLFHIVTPDVHTLKNASNKYHQLRHTEI